MGAFNRNSRLHWAESIGCETGSKFKEDGHLYTTLSIATIAGYDKSRAFRLAYFCQYPDLDPNYDATHVAIKYLLLACQWRWRNSITGVLHSLHGGDQTAIDERRKKLKTLISKTKHDPELDWLTGLLIHAYGDAYAHTKGELNQNEVAYGKWIGHLIPPLKGEDPDDLSNTTTLRKYLAYIENLYEAIQLPHAKHGELLAFSDYVRTLATQAGVHPDFSVLQKYTEGTKSEIDSYVECVSRNSRRLTRTEIWRAMHLITTA
jgi:uncharacterized protein Usg